MTNDKVCEAHDWFDFRLVPLLSYSLGPASLQHRPGPTAASIWTGGVDSHRSSSWYGLLPRNHFDSFCCL